MYLVVGLGNPGRRYERTRHNVGFLVADRLAEKWGERCSKAQLGAEVARITLRGIEAVIAKPQSFMNLSGQPASSLRGYYKVDVPNVIVVHDDLDIPFGQVRVKVGGGHGGHNGLRDLQAKFGDAGFVRVRFGVGRPPPGWDTADYVLGVFPLTEEAALPGLLDRSVDAVERIIFDGVVAAMNVFNTREKGS
jgi:PTH1 family peptidyl-tRNA hydrolase